MLRHDPQRKTQVLLCQEALAPLLDPLLVGCGVYFMILKPLTQFKVMELNPIRENEVGLETPTAYVELEDVIGADSA